jgi:hypothetical protein
VTIEVRERDASEPSRCPFCHDGIESEDWRCPVCDARYHLACARETGVCSVMGCKGVVSPETKGTTKKKSPPRASGRWYENVRVRIAALPVGIASLWVGHTILEPFANPRSDAGMFALTVVLILFMAPLIFAVPVAIGWERFFRFWPED